MKANELRIGNIIECPKGETHTVNLDTFRRICECVIEDGIYPIPLTEKWLTDFGFISKDYDLELGYIKWNKKESNYGCEFINSNFWIVPNGDDDHYRIPINLEYVHQLQNLHFALTGTELTLNK
jgi:hypothetical protein